MFHAIFLQPSPNLTFVTFWVWTEFEWQTKRLATFLASPLDQFCFSMPINSGGSEKKPTIGRRRGVDFFSRRGFCRICELLGKQKQWLRSSLSEFMDLCSLWPINSGSEEERERAREQEILSALRALRKADGGRGLCLSLFGWGREPSGCPLSE